METPQGYMAQPPRSKIGGVMAHEKAGEWWLAQPDADTAGPMAPMLDRHAAHVLRELAEEARDNEAGRIAIGMKVSGWLRAEAQKLEKDE